MQQYLDNLRLIHGSGTQHAARTKSDRVSMFALSETYNLANGFPLVTTRFISFAAVLEELLFFRDGKTNITLEGGPFNIWKKWAVDKELLDKELEVHLAMQQDMFKDAPVPADQMEKLRADTIHTWGESTKDLIGEIGPMYGRIWRNAPRSTDGPLFCQKRPLDQLPSDKLDHWKKLYDEYCFLTQSTPEGGFEAFAQGEYGKGFDQLNELINNLKTNPHSARHVVSAWVPDLVPPEHIRPKVAVLQGYGALAPCHAFFQCFVRQMGSVKFLDLQMYQRSVDYPVGRPFNIAQYALLTHMLAHCTGMYPGRLILPTGDAHIYANQLEKVPEQLGRQPLPLPRLIINPDVRDFFALKATDFELVGYEHHPKIVYEVSE